MPKPYKHLTQEDRDRLSLLKVQGKFLREIAGLIGRDVSTVSRELARNAPPIRQGYYLPHRAQQRADARKAIGHERERLRKLVRACAIKGASLQTLRHSFASHLVMNGTDVYTVQKLLGHSSIKTTEIYAHLAPDFLKAAVEKLEF